MHAVYSSLWCLGLGGVLCVGMVAGCDRVSHPASREAPEVTALRIVPDSINGTQLPDDRVQDSVAQVPLRFSARAADPDEAVERVVFTFEPATTPEETVSGELVPMEDDRYAREVSFSVPADRDEVYTIRVFAVDTDRLSSNQSVGQFRFVPGE